ncbi:hypothetical protein PR048_032540 [Dryococelus australis]|uniref:Uncharacterized protein n=1 Tax=Dryococelus australis TaxID=614101 RepID=A0ABQ9G2G6_9NEOP|nr:hypothetical protein PR048_032540 [Dryococelus australis]
MRVKRGDREAALKCKGGETEDPRENPSSSGTATYENLAVAPPGIEPRRAAEAPGGAAGGRVSAMLHRVASRRVAATDFLDPRAKDAGDRLTPPLVFPRQFASLIAGPASCAVPTKMARVSWVVEVSMKQHLIERAGGTEEREITEKTHRPKASSGRIPICGNPGVTRPGIEPGSLWWEASRQTAQPPRPLHIHSFYSLLFSDCRQHMMAVAPLLAIMGFARCKSAIGSEACREGLINCEPIAKMNPLVVAVATEPGRGNVTVVFAHYERSCSKTA